MNGKGFITVVASVLLSGVTAFAVVKAVDPKDQQEVKTVYNEAGQPVKTVNLSLSDYPDFTYAAETAVQTVVYVEVYGERRAQRQQQMPQQFMDPFFEFFFGSPYGQQPQQPQQRQPQSQDQEERPMGSGSGVIIRPDGYIVTNNHVVASATKVKVMLNDNQKYDATIVGTDEATDVALLKIDAQNLPAVQFADSDKLRLGEWVLAIGSPLGAELRSTITAGIVSAKGRQMPTNDREFKIESFIQTDAAVNPGNSGGALVNKQGELVGINTAIVSTTGSYAGYSFAVPSNIVQKIVSDLIDFGSVKRAMLGITGGTVTQELIKKQNLKLDKPEGVYVQSVSPNGTADKAGIKAEDVIVALDDVKIATMPELQAKVNNFHPGDKAIVKVMRAGKAIELNVTFEGAVDNNGAESADGTVSFYGASLKAAENGVLIVSAGSGKLAQAGGQDGFVIQYVNDQKVSKPKDVIDIAKKSKRSVFIEGVTANGRPGYFGFGKD